MRQGHASPEQASRRQAGGLTGRHAGTHVQDFVSAFAVQDGADEGLDGAKGLKRVPEGGSRVSHNRTTSPTTVSQLVCQAAVVPALVSGQAAGKLPAQAPQSLLPGRPDTPGQARQAAARPLTFACSKR
jgi:hypothetical protein